MNTTLRDVISEKCRKKVISSMESCEEEEEEAEDTEGKGSETSEDLPFEDILADKRRTYSAKEEFIYLLYNDILMYFVKEWDGKYLRKKPKKRIDDDSKVSSNDEEDIIAEEKSNEVTNDSKGSGNNSEEYDNGTTKSSSVSSWKLRLPDEFANIKFISNNTYSGRISRKMMEGEGVYRWSNGAQYKGEFEQNRMHGKGLLEWNNVCWYEGEFTNGYQHGRGIIVDGENRYMYTGQWHMGQRHGKGYSRYRDNGSYDGDWVMNKMEGIGLRIYPSGARYIGQWKNGIRDGKGTMVWTNGNVYRGEWKCGAMHGYGEYIWNGFFNKTFTWPQEASYVGYWRHGVRHGKGEMKLNSVGGAKYSGYWKDNKKHGYGIIIGSNGETFESDPLFLNDILCATNIETDNFENETESKSEKECVRVVKESKPIFPEKPDELAEASITPILRPEQFPNLSYYVTRLLDPKSLEARRVPSILSGKCFSCENESCSCLARPTSIGTIATEKNPTQSQTSETYTESSMEESSWKYEELWTYKCLTFHMLRLRQIYNDYAKLFTKLAPKCNLAMSRLCLWQLWRDCGVHKRGLSLVEIDDHIARNKATSVKDLHRPFEKIEIWQFLHALLEVSWHLYTKHDDIDAEEMNGKLAAGLHKFLKNDVYPHAGNHVGSLYHENQDLLPIYCVFELCQRIGYPFSAKDLLRLIFVSKDTRSSSTVEAIKNFPDGINSVMIGEKVSYLLKIDEIFTLPHCTIDISRKSDKDLFVNGLLVFGELGTAKMLEIMTLICPGIKDADSGIIINMDYKLTFLEFYETILEATKQLLSLRKRADKLLQTRKIEKETTSSRNKLQEKGTSRMTENSLIQKDSKVKKRNLI